MARDSKKMRDTGADGYWKSRRMELARLRFFALFQWQRIVGISSLSLVTFLLVFFVFGRIKIGGFLPVTSGRMAWPDLPAFFSQKSTTPDGETEARFSVPTRQLTAQELSQMGATGPNAAPSK